jgi:transposase
VWQKRLFPAPEQSDMMISYRDRRLLDKWARSRTLAARVVIRSRIVLMIADGASVKSISNVLGVAAGTVRLWRRRFDEGGPDALLGDAPGRGRKPILDEQTRQSLRTGTDHGHASSVRARGRELGVSATTISRWRRRRV